MWVNILTHEQSKSYMLLTDEDIGNGETYVLNDLVMDGWNEFSNCNKNYRQAKTYMEDFYTEYKQIQYDTCPITFKEASDFVNQHHRHHVSPQGHKFSVALSSANKVIAVAIAGRPVSRYQDDGKTIEITRMCAKPGYKNACSMLYAKVCRIAKELGYHRVLTYTLEEEAGHSLRAAGFDLIGNGQGGSWSNNRRRRNDKHPLGPKKIWEYKIA